MATATCVPGGGLSRADLLSEIQTRLDLTESDVERMRRRFRSLSPDPERGALLRQLEIAASVAGELESLAALGGQPQQTHNR